MKNYLPLALVLCGAAGTAFAGPVGSQEALEIAKQFYLSKLEASGRAKAPADIDFTIAFDSNSDAASSSARKAKAVSGNPTYYVVNAGNSGYVVVSGDDDALPVLGYTLNGTADESNLPINMREWLEFYDNEINALRADTKDKGMAVEPLTSPTDGYTNVIYPLLGDIKWNQDSPYNDQCPTYNNQRTVTGCVATAIGQIMRYYRYPTKPTGSVNYTSDLGMQVRVNYDGVTYDYDKMLPNYSATPGTAEERAEVAKFLYHVGAASNMNYMLSIMGGSGATNYNLINGLLEHFGYSNQLKLVNRFNTSTEAWHAAIQQELAAGRPVFHTGSGDGGHAFVCDGYDGAGMYHFNWGWGGMSDGYFVLSSLVPNSQGIGGNTTGYDYLQSIITNLKPASESDGATRTELGIYPTYYSTERDETKGVTPSATSVELGQSFSLTFGVMTSGAFPFQGFISALLLDESGNVVEELSKILVANLKGGFYNDRQSMSTKIPTNVKEGTYRLVLGYKETQYQDEDWNIMRGWYASTPSQLVVNVAYGKATMSYLGRADITASQVTVPEQVMTGKNAQFSVTFGNNGESYYSMLGVLIKGKDNGQQQNNLEMVQYINNGDENTVTVSGRITVPAGTYLVYPMYDSAGNVEAPQLATVPGVEPVEIEIAESDGNPSFSIQPLEDGSMNISTKSGMGYKSEFSVRLKNDGGFFAGNIRVRSTDNLDGAAFGYAVIGAGETVDVTVSGEMMLDPGTHTAQVAYDNGSGYITISGNYQLTVEAFTSIDETAGDGALRIYPSPADDLVTVEGSEEIDVVQLYDTTGALVLTQEGCGTQVTLNVGELPSGLYLARVLSHDNATVLRVVKR